VKPVRYAAAVGLVTAAAAAYAAADWLRVRVRSAAADRRRTEALRAFRADHRGCDPQLVMGGGGLWGFWCEPHRIGIGFAGDRTGTLRQGKTCVKCDRPIFDPQLAPGEPERCDSCADPV
jgi:hypothetical protein